MESGNAEIWVSSSGLGNFRKVHRKNIWGWSVRKTETVTDIYHRLIWTSENTGTIFPFSQVVCGLINEKRLENNLRALAQVEAVPELLWLVDALPSFILLSAVPILIISFVTGCLFATCGIMGAKANSECCACCYCCCNASYCLFLVVMLGLAGAFLHNMSLASGMAELWFARCDPKICYPLGYETRRFLWVTFFDSFSRRWFHLFSSPYQGRLG